MSSMDTTCLEVRRELTTDPKSRSPVIMKHLSSCNSCADYLQEIKLFNDKLSTAIKVEAPEGLESRILLAQRMGQSQISNATKYSNYTWMSLAAGIVLAIGLSISMYKFGESHGLEQDVLAHVYNELYILEKDENIQLASLNILLKPHGIQANEGIGHIRHAANCPFGDKFVPHIILDDQGKAVTVMYIPWENVGKRIQLEDQRFKGTLFGAQQGSFVILTEDREVLEGMENRVMSSIQTRI